MTGTAWASITVTVGAVVLVALGVLLVRRESRTAPRPATHAVRWSDRDYVSISRAPTPEELAAGHAAWRQRLEERAQTEAIRSRAARRVTPKFISGPCTEDVLRQVEVLRKPQGIRDSHVYIIQLGDSGPTKVGRAIDVGGRLRSFQTANAETLRLVAVIPFGGYDVETALHRALAGYRVKGEWFDLRDPEGIVRSLSLRQ